MGRLLVAPRSAAAVAAGAVLLVVAWAMFMASATAQNTEDNHATVGQILAAAEAQDGDEGFDATAFGEALNEFAAQHDGETLRADSPVSRDAVNYALGVATGVDVEVDGGTQNWKNMRDSCMSFGYTQGEDDFGGDQNTSVTNIFGSGWIERRPCGGGDTYTPRRWRPPPPRLAVAGIKAHSAYEGSGSAQLVVSLNQPATTRVTFTVSYRQAAAVGHRGARCHPRYWRPYGAAACGPSTSRDA